jgi:hypothetical protein
LLKITKSPKSDEKSPGDDSSLKSDLKSPRDDFSYQDDFTEDITTHKHPSVHTLPHSETTDLKPQPSPHLREESSPGLFSSDLGDFVILSKPEDVFDFSE